MRIIHPEVGIVKRYWGGQCTPRSQCWQEQSAVRRHLCISHCSCRTSQLTIFIIMQLINFFCNYVTTWKYCCCIKCQLHATEVCWCRLIDVWVKKVILQQIKFICIKLHTHYSWSVEEWWQLLLCHSQACWYSREPTVSCQESLRVRDAPLFLHQLLDDRQTAKLAGSVSK